MHAFFGELLGIGKIDLIKFLEAKQTFSHHHLCFWKNNNRGYNWNCQKPQRQKTLRGDLWPRGYLTPGALFLLPFCFVFFFGIPFHEFLFWNSFPWNFVGKWYGPRKFPHLSWLFVTFCILFFCIYIFYFSHIFRISMLPCSHQS